jgi:hypothetical protein
MIAPFDLRPDESAIRARSRAPENLSGRDWHQDMKRAECVISAGFRGTAGAHARVRASRTSHVSQPAPSLDPDARCAGNE